MAGLSLQYRTQLLKQVLEEIYKLTPITCRYEPSDVLKTNPIAIIRDCLDGMKALLNIHLDCEVLYGHTPYHYSQIINEKVCYSPDIVHTKYNIPIGAKYYEFKDPVTASLTGDGGFMPRTPYGTPTNPVAFLRLLNLNNYLQHCKHAGICVLFSALGDHDVRVEKWMQEIDEKFDKNGSFALYSKKKQCYCIFHYVRFDNGDWSWSHQMITRTVGPSGEYYLTGLVRWKNGVPKNVQTTRKFKLYHALCSKFTRDDEDNKTEEQLKEEKWTGYRLITPKIAMEFAELTEIALEMWYADHPNVILTKKEERILRTNIGRRFKHGWLYRKKEGKTDNDSMFDPNHMWWSWDLNSMFFVHI